MSGASIGKLLTQAVNTAKREVNLGDRNNTEGEK